LVLRRVKQKKLEFVAFENHDRKVLLIEFAMEKCMQPNMLLNIFLVLLYIDSPPKNIYGLVHEFLNFEIFQNSLHSKKTLVFLFKTSNFYVR
jgi:hypothetical protein